MKKYDLLKKIGIVFFVVVLLSWVIPAGVYSNGSFSTTNTTSPIGIHGIISSPIIAFEAFLSTCLLILSIGGFYGVLNKTGAYTNLVETIVSKFKKHENKFLIITMVVISLLSAFVGTTSAILIMIPFFMTILLKLNFSKLKTLAATIGSMLVGNFVSVMGTDVWANFAMAFGLKTTQNIFVKIITLVIILTLFVILISRKKEEKEENHNIPLYKEQESKRAFVPLIVVFGLLFIIVVLGTYRFKEIFNFTFFSELNEALMSVKIGKYPIFANVLGKVSEFGTWGDYDIVISLGLASFVVAWLYNIKVKDTLDSFIKGAKEMVTPAIYAVLASLVMVVVLNLGSNFVFTMVSKFLPENSQFSFMGVIASALVASPIYNNFYILIGNFYQAFALNDANTIPTVAFIFQSIYGLIMMIVPTSMLLLAGISYLNVSYKDWVNYIWKFVLISFIVVIAIAFIMATFL